MVEENGLKKRCDYRVCVTGSGSNCDTLRFKKLVILKYLGKIVASFEHFHYNYTVWLGPRQVFPRPLKLVNSDGKFTKNKRNKF